MKRILSIAICLFAAIAISSCSKSEIDDISSDIIDQWGGSKIYQDYFETIIFHDKSTLSLRIKNNGTVTNHTCTYRIFKEDGHVWIEFEDVEDSTKFRYCIFKYNHEEMMWTNDPIAGDWWMKYSRNHIFFLDDINRK